MIEQVFKSKVAVVIPLYKESLTISERFSFDLTISTLSKHDIYIICPWKISSFIVTISQNLNVPIKIIYFENKYFFNVNSYNRLMTSIQFYKRFIDYEYILIVQTDALVFFDELDYWCNLGYSYIGAPWFKDDDYGNKSFEFLGVGNGGFSLRKVNSFIKVLNDFRYIPNFIISSQPNISKLIRYLKIIKHHFIFSYNIFPLLPTANEDYFWGVLVSNKCPFFSVPKPDIACSFAFEVHPRYMYKLNKNRIPFGCHGWERYDIEFWKAKLYELGIDMQWCT